MTVSYSGSIATISYGSFIRLLFRWRGSVYKLVWFEIVVFSAAYILVSLLYRFLPQHTSAPDETRQIFIKLCIYANRLSDAVPLSFVLGFYVNLVVSRWWKQFLALPTPDGVCLLLTGYLHGSEANKHLTGSKDRALLFRQAISRYLNLSSALCLRSISLSMKQCFPAVENLVATGLMTEQELNLYTAFEVEHFNCFFVPLVWSVALISRAHYEGMIRYERHADALINEVVLFWQKLFTLFNYDWVNVPLVYNQVVALAVYVYFAVCVLSQQFVDPVAILRRASLRSAQSLLSVDPLANVTSFGKTMSPIMYGANDSSVLPATSSPYDVPFHIPVFTLLELIFYTGWLKVAESHLFPFGHDDDDFDVVPLLDRNIQASKWLVDAAVNDDHLIPMLVKSGCDVDEVEKWDPRRRISVARPAPKRKPSAPVASGDTVADEVDLDPNSPSPSFLVDEVCELPCPDYLRHPESKYFLTGSVARLRDDVGMTQHGDTGLTPDSQSVFSADLPTDGPRFRSRSIHLLRRMSATLGFGRRVRPTHSSVIDISPFSASSSPAHEMTELKYIA